MSDNLDLKQKLIIIKHSGLEDVTILDNNYKQLIRDTDNQEDKLEFVILRSTVLDRLKELTT